MSVYQITMIASTLGLIPSPTWKFDHVDETICELFSIQIENDFLPNNTIAILDQ